MNKKYCIVYNSNNSQFDSNEKNWYFEFVEEDDDKLKQCLYTHSRYLKNKDVEIYFFWNVIPLFSKISNKLVTMIELDA